MLAPSFSRFGRIALRSAPKRTAALRLQALRAISTTGSTSVEVHPGKMAGSKGNVEQMKDKKDVDYLLMHPVYTQEELDVKITHYEPKTVADKAAFRFMQLFRVGFDFFTGYGTTMDEDKYLRRFLFLETVAGVPGMVGAMWRHLSSLRTLRRDHGWIHTLLEEAENERMHLLTFLSMKKPSLVFRTTVLGAQAVFWNLYFLIYITSPTTAHRFVGYLEEEACKTYTRCIEDIDNDRLPAWKNMDAPKIGKKYWMLADDAKMRDLILAVRADEACHRYVNHTFASMKPHQPNPFVAGSTAHD
eukprot:CAMPEP_0196780868 /NCGR_PEP_ID=MMETSP1104-20130614/8694_1 /TAXON_ID=33652 /ORGANISM="Cafeteria sp., Strain Caron Lab Isolate" /LENGTH=301 /DNA_ID=CAMNT_0042151083 /DNA_START=53 /DNA_END=958 /DNA_ORIENTATION=-